MWREGMAWEGVELDQPFFFQTWIILDERKRLIPGKLSSLILVSTSTTTQETQPKTRTIQRFNDNNNVGFRITWLTCKSLQSIVPHQSFSMYYFISLLHFLPQLATHALYTRTREGHAAMQSSSDPPGQEPRDPFRPFLFRPFLFLDAFLVTFSRVSMPSTSLHCTFPSSKSFT